MRFHDTNLFPLSQRTAFEPERRARFLPGRHYRGGALMAKVV